MTQFYCPGCNRICTVMPGAGNNDYEHQCNSGNEVLDNQDLYPKIDNPQWNLQGAGNKLSTSAQIDGGSLNDLTSRGNISETHKTRQNYQFIDNINALPNTNKMKENSQT